MSKAHNLPAYGSVRKADAPLLRPWGEYKKLSLFLSKFADKSIEILSRNFWINFAVDITSPEVNS